MRPCALKLDRAGFVLTGAAVPGAAPGKPALEASLPGVFAIGDVRSGSVKRVGGAIGEGAAVVAAIHAALATPTLADAGLRKRDALHGMLRVLARPVRTARGARGVVLQPYRGYGSTERIFVIGRAFWQRTDPEPAVEAEIRDILRRIRRRPVRGARIRARFYGAERVVETDRDGYFRIEMAPGGPVPRDRLWHRLELTMLAPARIETAAEVYIPPDAARVVVVSDIDDTVMHTGVANKAAMLWRLFVAGRREPDGVSRGVAPLPGAARRRVGRRSATRCSTSRARPGGSTTSSRRSSGATRSRSARSCSCANGGSAGATRCRGGPSITSAT